MEKNKPQLKRQISEEEKKAKKMKQIDILTNEYGLSINEIKDYIKCGMQEILLNTIEVTEENIRSKKSSDQGLEKCISLYLGDFSHKFGILPEMLKKERVQQILSRPGNIFFLQQYLPTFTNKDDYRFTEMDKDIFLLKQCIINYLATVPAMKKKEHISNEDAILISFLGLKKDSEQSQETFQANIGNVISFIQLHPTVKSYLAGLYFDNLKIGSKHLAAKIVINENARKLLEILDELEKNRIKQFHAGHPSFR